MFADDLAMTEKSDLDVMGVFEEWNRKACKSIWRKVS